MYYILVYDIHEKRVAKALKLCRQYLNWIQNSVFEGELTPSQLDELIVKILKLIDEEYDSVIIFEGNQKWINKKCLGREKNSTDTFL